MFTVTADPEKLARARGKGLLPLDPLEAALRDPRSLSEPACVHLLRADRDRHCSLLRARAVGAEAQEDRIAIAIVLTFLGDPAGETILQSVLAEAGDEATVIAVLGHIAWGWMAVSEIDLPTRLHRRRGAPSTNPALGQTLVGLLDPQRPDVLRAAVPVCGALEPVGALPRFLELLAMPGDLPRSAMALHHAFAPTAAFLAWLEASLVDAEGEAREGLLHALCVVGYQEGALAERACDRIHELAVAHADLPGNLQSIMYPLAKHPRAAYAAFCERVLNTSRETLSRLHALEILARTRPLPDAVTLVRSFVTDEQLSYHALGVLLALAGGADPVFAEQVLTEVEKRDPDRRAALLGRAIELGATDTVRIDRLLATLPTHDRRDLEWQRVDKRPREVLRRLIELGLAPAGIALDAVDDAPATMETLHEILEEHGVLLVFDTETGTCPPHAALVRWFAWHSARRFQPEAIVATVGSYVEFVVQGQLFQVELQEYGDSYDHAGVAEAVNAALDLARVPERFTSIATDGQDAAYVLGTPAAVNQAKKIIGV